MKTAHIFNLKVDFKNGQKWDLDILARDITWIFNFIHNDNVEIESMNIQLIKENAEEVKENFGAKSIKNNLQTA